MPIRKKLVDGPWCPNPLAPNDVCTVDGKHRVALVCRAGITAEEQIIIARHMASAPALAAALNLVTEKLALFIGSEFQVDDVKPSDKDSAIRVARIALRYYKTGT